MEFIFFLLNKGTSITTSKSFLFDDFSIIKKIDKL